MPKFLNKTAVITLGCVLIACSVPTVALGLRANDHSASAEASKALRLDAIKLRICQRHETVINNIMGRIADRGQRHLDVFDTIATRVEDFYTKKGNIVSNYDALVATVNAQKSAAQDTLAQIKADKADFKCDGSDPKGVGQAFKADLKIEIKALHDYQQSIKDLIVAVKTAQSNGTSSNSSDGGGDQ